MDEMEAARFEAKVRRAAKGVGWRLEKSRTRSAHLDDQGLYRLVDGNIVISGDRFDATLEVCEHWIEAERLRQAAQSFRAAGLVAPLAGLSRAAAVAHSALTFKRERPMDVKLAEKSLRRINAAIDALTNARKAVESGFGLGIDHVDEAIKVQKAALLEHMEMVAAVDWWNPADVPALASLIAEAERHLGLYAGGPVVRLAIKIGKICQPYETVDAAA